jgi:hypothetical protein
MRIILITRIVLMLCMAHVIAHGSETRRKLIVCLQVEVNDRHLISTLAQGLATRMFAGAGIRLEWTGCRPAGESSQAPIVVQLVTGTPEGFQSGVLGYAMPYRRHIIIFFDRIETMQGAWTVLGHVMVHEITHVIQGVARHSHTGLMKPHWSPRDLREMLNKPLPFTQEDLMMLDSGLAMRRESTDTPTVRDDPAVWLVYPRGSPPRYWDRRYPLPESKRLRPQKPDLSILSPCILMVGLTEGNPND